MSISLMSLAFKSSVPATQKLVLLALADAANDQGECYPSVQTLSAKCSLSERAIRQAFCDLEQAGHLCREHRLGRSTIYWVSPQLSSTPATRAPLHHVHHAQNADSPAPHAGLPLHHVQDTPAPRAPITIREPSVETSLTRKKRATTSSIARPESISEQLWADWIAVRKEKRAGPVTTTAWEAVEREAMKAGISPEQAIRACCEFAWQGFNAGWYEQRQGNNGLQPTRRASAIVASNYPSDAVETSAKIAAEAALPLCKPSAAVQEHMRKIKAGYKIPLA